MEIGITEDKFKKFMKVRRSGITNMFDVDNVSRLSGLEKAEVKYIIHNFDMLYDKYVEKKEK